eukprot:1158884-Pelagomonas_calceolata.AAC.5
MFIAHRCPCWIISTPHDLATLVPCAWHENQYKGGPWYASGLAWKIRSKNFNRLVCTQIRQAHLMLGSVSSLSTAFRRSSNSPGMNAPVHTCRNQHDSSECLMQSPPVHACRKQHGSFEFFHAITLSWLLILCLQSMHLQHKQQQQQPPPPSPAMIKLMTAATCHDQAPVMSKPRFTHTHTHTHSPAMSKPMSRATTATSRRVSGTSPAATRCARPSTSAVCTVVDAHAIQSERPLAKACTSKHKAWLSRHQGVVRGHFWPSMYLLCIKMAPTHIMGCAWQCRAS